MDIFLQIFPATWQIHFGDPTVGGWLIAAGYLLAAAAAFRARHAAVVGAREARRPGRKERRRNARDRAYRAAILFWTVMLFMLVLLGLNKQLDLHSWVTEVGRTMAREHGWYKSRRIVQQIAVIGLAAAAIVGIAALLWSTRCILPRQALAFVGMVLLGSFVLARAASFHHLDDWFGLSFAGIRTRMVVEAVGIACIVGCAWMNARWLTRIR